MFVCDFFKQNKRCIHTYVVTLRQINVKIITLDLATTHVEYMNINMVIGQMKICEIR